MFEQLRRVSLGTGLAALGGLIVAVSLGWYALRAADLAVLLESWIVPAVVALHLIEQVGCGCAWHSLVEPPRPSRWAFSRMRWVRASVAALMPVSGVGAALVAVRLATRAGLTLEMASASLVLDATMELTTQIIFIGLGFGFLFVSLPHLEIAEWAASTLLVAMVTVFLFIAAQRRGGLKLVEAGISRLARRWPKLMPLTEARLHERLMMLHQRRRAALVSASFHFGSWLLGSGEIWLVLFAFGHTGSPAKCVIIESLSMAARSAGFFIPGALGIQEIAVVAVGSLVGLSPETAMLIAIVKRLRDVVVGVPGLLVWQWTETDGLRLAPATPSRPLEVSASAEPDNSAC
jgi:putative membrane protein